MLKHHRQKQLEEEKVYVILYLGFYHSEYSEQTWRQELMQVSVGKKAAY